MDDAREGVDVAVGVRVGDAERVGEGDGEDEGVARAVRVRNGDESRDGERVGEVSRSSGGGL